MCDFVFRKINYDDYRKGYYLLFEKKKNLDDSINIDYYKFKNFVDNKGLFDEEKTSSIFFILLLFIIFSFPIIFKSALLMLSRLDDMICFDAAARDDGSFIKNWSVYVEYEGIDGNT